MVEKLEFRNFSEFKSKVDTFSRKKRKKRKKSILRCATLKKEKQGKERRRSGPGSNKAISAEATFASIEIRKN